MAKKRKAAGDAPGTSRPPARLMETAKEDEEVSLDASLPSRGARGSDGERGRVVVVPHPPQPPQPQPQLVAAGRDANPVAHRREERDLLADLGGRQAERDFALGFLHGRRAAAATSAAVGEEEEVASSWKSAPPSTQASPSGKRKEPAAAAQAQPLPHADQPAVAAAAAAQARPQRPARRSARIGGGAANDYVWCRSCGCGLATVRRVPVRHVCHCVSCRNSKGPDDRPCSFCNGTRC